MPPKPSKTPAAPPTWLKSTCSTGSPSNATPHSVVDADGNIDVCFNATSNDDIQGNALQDMRFEDFIQPVTKSLTAHFNIAATASAHMARSGGGVILVMAGGREAIPRLGGAHVAWAALAGLSRQLAADLGPDGIRVAWLLSPGSPSFADHEGPTAEPGDESQLRSSSRHPRSAPSSPAELRRGG